MAGLSLSLLLVVGLVSWTTLRESPYVAPGPRRPPATASAALAATTLERLEDAVADGDVRAAGRLAAGGDRSARRLLSAVVENAVDARVSDFSLRYVDEIGGVTPEGGWDAAVDVTWAFAGFDDVPAQAEVRFRFVRADDDDRVRLSAIGGGGRRSPVWMTGALEVRRSPRALVLAGNPGEAERYARLARRAVPDVQRVLRDWRGGLVVEVPGSARALHGALASDPGTYANIAAVTTAVDGSLTAGAPVHVFVNPEVFGALKPRGAQVVMSHEAVHVATDAATSTMPLWLLEGFADYVALRDVPLPLTVTAGQIIRQVRRQGVPARLPGPDDFDPTTPHLGASYEAAWLVCRLLADLGGERALVRFYRAVEAGTPVGRALDAGFGIGRRGLTRQWQGLLRDLAG